MVKVGKQWGSTTQPLPVQVCVPATEPELHPSSPSTLSLLIICNIYHLYPRGPNILWPNSSLVWSTCPAGNFMCVCRQFNLTSLHFSCNPPEKHGSKDKAVRRPRGDKWFSMCLPSSLPSDSCSLDLHQRQTPAKVFWKKSRLNGSKHKRIYKIWEILWWN